MFKAAKGARVGFHKVKPYSTWSMPGIVKAN